MKKSEEASKTVFEDIENIKSDCQSKLLNMTQEVEDAQFENKSLKKKNKNLNKITINLQVSNKEEIEKI